LIDDELSQINSDDANGDDQIYDTVDKYQLNDDTPARHDIAFPMSAERDSNPRRHTQLFPLITKSNIGRYFKPGPGEVYDAVAQREAGFYWPFAMRHLQSV